MRLFTDIEKQLIERLNTENGFNLYTLIDPWIDGVSFDIDRVKKKVVFIFENSFNDEERIIQRLREIQSVLIQAVNIVKLLEEKGYIFTFVSANTLPDNYVWGRAAINLPSVPYNFADPRISELIVKYSEQEVVVTPELGKFIGDNFRTREELRANRQFYTTLVALIVASVAFLTNVGFNIYNMNKANEGKPSNNHRPSHHHHFNCNCHE